MLYTESNSHADANLVPDDRLTAARHPATASPTVDAPGRKDRRPTRKRPKTARQSGKTNGELKDSNELSFGIEGPCAWVIYCSPVTQTSGRGIPREKDNQKGTAFGN
ncbi:hypothetical protein N7462_000192 [Penicillium macrosclerotiorum]|uniref:uncharacterized protein n=1 Tax=Penicillium macrosclerotiorum TaxID=303699 RepID=UPI0025476E9F|nr:uncharacterized protein N7462_000192 [Penicillium macrosclerotiorum]KAJ5698187.1 hypothetical protein N7462_000192 [Penicillium macrosclerotiorum]